MSSTGLACFAGKKKTSQENLLPSLRSYYWAEALSLLWVCWVNGDLMLGIITGCSIDLFWMWWDSPGWWQAPSSLSPAEQQGPGLPPAGSVLGGYFQSVFDFLFTRSNAAYLKMPGSLYLSSIAFIKWVITSQISGDGCPCVNSHII